MAKNAIKKNNNSKKDDKKEVKVSNKNTDTKKKTNKRKSYADSTKMNVSLEAKTTIWTIITVILVLVTFYVLSIYATGGSLFKSKDSSNEVEFQYDEILLGRSFDMGGSYYVMYYDMTDTENEQTAELENLVHTFKNNALDSTIYTCDLGNAFNKPFVTTEEANTNPYGAEDMLINGPTIISFADGKVVEYISGYDDVTNYVNSFVATDAE